MEERTAHDIVFLLVVGVVLLWCGVVWCGGVYLVIIIVIIIIIIIIVARSERVGVVALLPACLLVVRRSPLTNDE